MVTAGQAARRVILVSGAGVRVAGGPAQPIKLLTGNVQTTADPPLLVSVVTGRATLGGPSLPCVQVSSGGRAEGDVSATPVVLT